MITINSLKDAYDSFTIQARYNQETYTLGIIETRLNDPKTYKLKAIDYYKYQLRQAYTAEPKKFTYALIYLGFQTNFKTTSIWEYIKPSPATIFHSPQNDLKTTLETELDYWENKRWLTQGSGLAPYCKCHRNHPCSECFYDLLMSTNSSCVDSIRDKPNLQEFIIKMFRLFQTNSLKDTPVPKNPELSKPALESPPSPSPSPLLSCEPELPIRSNLSQVSHSHLCTGCGLKQPWSVSFNAKPACLVCRNPLRTFES